MTKVLMSSEALLKQNLLAMQLREVALKDLLLVDSCQRDIFTFKEGIFFVVVSEGSKITKETIRDLVRQKVEAIFVHPEDYEVIKESLKNELLRITRSLSVGNPLQNSRRQINLLAQNLSELYRNPLNDENLKLQYQCTVNLSKFLSEHKGLLPELYSDLFNGNHHFTMSQPMMASLLLVGFLQQFRLFHEKDIEMLFITSYLKDIGMSFIPEEKLDQKDLELHDKKIISRHADNSISLLEGRTPLARNHLNIIKNHHFLNKKIQAALSGIKTDSSQNSLMGLETEMVAVMDVLVAMINDRPYRAGQPLFQSLELLSKVMADDYPSEFKALVNYLRYFFTKMSA